MVGRFNGIMNNQFSLVVGREHKSKYTVQLSVKTSLELARRE